VDSCDDSRSAGGCTLGRWSFLLYDARGAQVSRVPPRPARWRRRRVTAFDCCASSAHGRGWRRGSSRLAPFSARSRGVERDTPRAGVYRKPFMARVGPALHTVFRKSIGEACVEVVACAERSSLSPPNSSSMSMQRVLILWYARTIILGSVSLIGARSPPPRRAVCSA